MASLVKNDTSMAKINKENSAKTTDIRGSTNVCRSELGLLLDKFNLVLIKNVILYFVPVTQGRE